MMTVNKGWKYISFVLILGGLGFMSAMILEGVVVLGVNIPQADLQTDYVVAVLWSVVLGLGIFAWPVPSMDKLYLAVAWTAKVLVVLGFMLFYESHYLLDSYGYFDESRAENFMWEGLEIGAGTQNITHLAWLHQQLIPDSYHAMKVSFAMVGLIGIYLFYRAAVNFLGGEDKRIFFVLALFPSILFWSSVLGKDPIVFLGIGLYVFGVVGWYRRRRTGYLLALGIGVALASLIRVWMGPILLAPLGMLFILGLRGIFAKVSFLLLLLVALSLSMVPFVEMFNLELAEDILEVTERVSQSWAIGGSTQEIELRSVPEMIAFAPLGAFTALFRPLPGEVLNLFGVLAGLENLVLILLLWKAVQRTHFAELRAPLLVWAMALILVWATVYGFVSYQNLGTAVRFKLQVLPVLLGLLLFLSRRRSVAPPVTLQRQMRQPATSG